MMQWALREHPNLWGGQESDYLVLLIAGLRQSFDFGRQRGKLHWLSSQDVSWGEFEHVVYELVGSGYSTLLAADNGGGSLWIRRTTESDDG